MDVSTLRFDQRGLIPAIVQQHDTGEVLMLAWMSPQTVRESLDRGETVFWSRSRDARWHKGATSGNVQKIVSMTADCDADVLLVRVDQQGSGACHTGARSCFSAGEARPPRVSRNQDPRSPRNHLGADHV